MTDEEQKMPEPATFFIWLKNQTGPAMVKDCIGIDFLSSPVWVFAYGLNGTIAAWPSADVLRVEFPVYDDHVITNLV